MSGVDKPAEGENLDPNFMKAVNDVFTSLGPREGTKITDVMTDPRVQPLTEVLKFALKEDPMDPPMVAEDILIKAKRPDATLGDGDGYSTVQRRIAEELALCVITDKKSELSPKAREEIIKRTLEVDCKERMMGGLMARDAEAASKERLNRTLSGPLKTLASKVCNPGQGAFVERAASAVAAMKNTGIISEQTARYQENKLERARAWKRNAAHNRRG